ncbi:MAG: hypothetical protein WDM90_16790 [Ferruginibacter sp.]
MRKLITAILLILSITVKAQNSTASNIIEGGKTLVELVRVFKTPKNIPPQQNLVEKKDSCSIKNICDLCIKNSTAKALTVSLYKRNGNTYDAIALTMKVLPKNQEYFYELKSGIYKMKLETEEQDVKKIFREGEIKLNACERT